MLRCNRRANSRNLPALLLAKTISLNIVVLSLLLHQCLSLFVAGKEQDAANLAQHGNKSGDETHDGDAGAVVGPKISGCHHQQGKQ